MASLSLPLPASRSLFPAVHCPVSIMRPLSRTALRPYVCPSCQLGRLPARRRYASHSPTNAAAPEIYDVVCVGGGPAGLGLLAALRMLLQCAVYIQLASLTDFSRGFSHHLQAESRPGRNSGPEQSPLVVSRCAELLQPRQQPDSLLRLVPEEDRRLGSP